MAPPRARTLSKARELKIAMLTSIRHNRALLPRYLLGPRVLAWQCSICRKMFSLRVEEVDSLASAIPPAHIRAAFEAHDCVLELELLAERAQQSLPRR